MQHPLQERAVQHWRRGVAVAEAAHALVQRGTTTAPTAPPAKRVRVEATRDVAHCALFWSRDSSQPSGGSGDLGVSLVVRDALRLLCFFPSLLLCVSALRFFVGLSRVVLVHDAGPGSAGAGPAVPLRASALSVSAGRAGPIGLCRPGFPRWQHLLPPLDAEQLGMLAAPTTTATAPTPRRHELLQHPHERSALELGHRGRVARVQGQRVNDGSGPGAVANIGTARGGRGRGRGRGGG